MASSSKPGLPTFGKRLIGGLLLFAVVLAFLIAGGYPFALFVLLLGGVALHEYAQIFAKRGYQVSTTLMVLWLAGFMATRLFPDQTVGRPLLAILTIITLAWMVYRFIEGDETAAIEFALTLSGGFLLGWSLSHLISLRNLEDGLFWCLALIFATSGADTGAYLFGSLFGKHRFFEKISPKKSVEGYIGGLIFGPLLTGVMMLLFRELGAGPAFTFTRGLLIGLLIAPFCPLGDLAVSVIKRFAGVKDTGTIIPGHGGIFDRVDSYIISALILYYAVLVFNI